MPDHVHIIMSKKFDSARNQTYRLSEIMSSIKGATSHAINKLLNRRGSVWQEESFDHITRSNESLNQKIAYILDNPVRKGLVEHLKDYPHLWRFIPPEQL
jgi:REP element-mobilizing transposase RayT